MAATKGTGGMRKDWRGLSGPGVVMARNQGQSPPGQPFREDVFGAIKRPASQLWRHPTSRPCPGSRLAAQVREQVGYVNSRTAPVRRKVCDITRPTERSLYPALDAPSLHTVGPTHHQTTGCVLRSASAGWARIHRGYRVCRYAARSIRDLPMTGWFRTGRKSRVQCLARKNKC